MMTDQQMKHWTRLRDSAANMLAVMEGTHPRFRVRAGEAEIRRMRQRHTSLADFVQRQHRLRPTC